MPQIRLHKYIQDYLKSQNNFSYTTNEMKKNISNYGVLVDGKLVKNQLEWVYPEQSFELNNWPARNQGDTSKIKTIFENDDCLVLYKPYGLVIEPGAGHRYDNLVSWLIEKYPKQNFRERYKNIDQTKLQITQKKLNQNSEIHQKIIPNINPQTKLVFKNGRMQLKNTQVDDYNSSYTTNENVNYDKAKDTDLLPASGLVHRLDKDTQGLVLVAKNLENFNFFQNQFRQRTVTKKYLAIVEGQFDRTIEIHNWQSRDKVNPLRQKFFWTQSEAISLDPLSRNAHSILQPVLYNQDLDQSLIQIQIKTGRMHQIRLQCENLGFPLVGDKIYNHSITFDHTTFASNQDNKSFLSIKNKLKQISKEEFVKRKNQIFGENKYCLLSNEIEIMLPNQNLAKFVLFEV